MACNSMKTSSRPGKPFRLSDFVHRRVHSYALMAMFTVGFLTLGQPAAQAAVVYTPTNVTISAGILHTYGQYGLDLNNDGVIDFTIRVGYEPTVRCRDGSSRVVTFAEEIPAAGNDAVGAPPAALEKGDPIGPSQTFHAQVGVLRAYSECTLRWYGAFGGQERYLGLRFQINGKTHYGWARLTAFASGYEARSTVTGYAYETTPGEPINAGQTSGTINEMDEDSSGGASLTNPTPDPVRPVSLRALALWDRGILCRRKEPVGAAF